MTPAQQRPSHLHTSSFRLDCSSEASSPLRCASALLALNASCSFTPRSILLRQFNQNINKTQDNTRYTGKVSYYLMFSTFWSASFTSPGDGTRPTKLRTCDSIFEAAEATWPRFVVNCGRRIRNVSIHSSRKSNKQRMFYLRQLGFRRLNLSQSRSANIIWQNRNPQGFTSSQAQPLTSNQPRYQQACSFLR